MKKIILFSFLFIFILSCSDVNEYDECLKNLEVVKSFDDFNGNQIFEIIGTVDSYGKCAIEFEDAIEETLNIKNINLIGGLTFKETPGYYGFFIIDTRLSINLKKIKHDKKNRVILRRVKLKNAVSLITRKQQYVEYLYLLQDIESI